MRQVARLSRIAYVLAPVTLLAVALIAAQASAKSYPSYECASAKMKAAAQRCKQVLGAWSLATKTQRDPQSRIDAADASFDAKWADAEDAAAAGNVDCAEMTLSSADMKTLMDDALAEIVADVTAGLDLGVGKEAACGAQILSKAGTMCRALLRAESRLIVDLPRDLDGERCDAVKAKSERQFRQRWDRATRRQCPTSATHEEIRDDVIALTDDVVTNITVSPNVPDDVFMAITHPAVGAPGHEVSYEGDVLGPRCQDSSQYSFFARRGTENKLLMYYEGGGACWDPVTCGAELCKQDVTLGDYIDLTTSTSGFGSGFADLSDPRNPFKDWNIVYVPYCTCDVHWGDAAVDYAALGPFPARHVEHRGYDNAKLAEKWVREHFLVPEDIFVTGSSAGAYGATVHAMPLNEAYPTASISMLGDAGNGVITQEFLEQQFGNWGVEQNLPDVPGVDDVPIPQLSIPKIIEAAARYYPDANWAHYSAAYDGGTGGQTGFYHVMLNPYLPPVWPNWWQSSCAFNDVMRQQTSDTEAAVSLENDNYRYYIASGSAHTMFGNPRVYLDTTGGVPPLVDWVNAMIDRDPSWTSVEASPYNVLFPDDPRPDPLQAPFETVGSDVLIECTPAP